jgi:hypothetical protein
MAGYVQHALPLTTHDTCAALLLQVEADAMFKALKREGKQGVQYVLYPDEGHGLTRLANRLDFYSRAEQLLADVLGGRRDRLLSPKTTSARVKS